ncbi:uncharacterized protein RB166_018931 [Leptodactylus fuscus]|uniref:uncharacterized protein LOC142183219 n=1 Tax=Leptodactylus fuscus TaxID=238119 RepID=UPI003F4E7491
MAADKNLVTGRILNLTLDLIYLLSGEDYMVVKKKCTTFCRYHCESEVLIRTPGSITKSALISNEKKNEMILDRTNKIIHLLTGEVPIRCQDVTVYFSMEEWKYLEGHKDMYKDIMMNTQQPLTFPDEFSNRNALEECPSHLCSLDCTVEIHNTPQVVPRAGGNKGKDFVIEITDEEKVEISTSDGQFKEKVVPIVISPKRHHDLSPESEGEIDILTSDNSVAEAASTTNVPPSHDSRDESGDSSDPVVETQSADHMKCKPYQCPDCEQCFTVRSSLLRHLKNHSVEKPFACTDCGKCFKRKSLLVKHLRSHTGEKPFSCMECGKGFMQKSNLTEHHRIHTGERPFSCPVCQKCFTYKSDLIKHQKIHTDEKPFSCSYCGKCFTQKLGLVRHERIHVGEKTFLCLACGKSFARKSELVKHERIHTGEKPFLCSECGKGFIQKSDLMRHHRIHTGEKPFPCSECEKRFILKSELVKHMRNHTGEKSFSCLHCEKRFAWKSELIKHQRFHTGEKPFQCSECGKCFTQKSDMMRHQIVHLR